MSDALPGMAVYGPSDITLEGTSLSGRTDVVSATLERSLSSAATLTVEVSDHSRDLLESGLIGQRSRATVDGIIFELHGVRKSGDMMSLTLIDAAAADLIHDVPKEPVTQRPGTHTRGDFVGRLLDRHEWIVREVESGDRAMVELATEPDETVWAALGRVADQVQWRRVAVANKVLVGSDEWLMGRSAVVPVREYRDGVDRIDFDWVSGEKAAKAALTVTASLWVASPGTAVEVSGSGPADGAWMVESIRRSLASTVATVDLVREQPELPEPAPAPPPAGYADGSGGAAAGGAVVAGATSGRGWQWPIAGRVGSGFGYRTHPIKKTRRLHAGVDIGAPTGTPIYAAKEGRVLHAGWRGGYGNAVYLEHAGGIISRYGHMSRVACTRGQSVRRGQLIGYCGSTGMSTGPHLHFEIRPGDRPVNPLNFLPPR